MRRKCGDMLRFPLFFFVFPSVNLDCINKANDAVTAAIGDAELGSYYSAPLPHGQPVYGLLGHCPVLNGISNVILAVFILRFKIVHAVVINIVRPNGL